MPIVISTWDADRERYVDLEYFDAYEVGQRLHMSARTVTRYTTERGLWPYTKLAGRPFLHRGHLARVVELLSHDPDRIYDASKPPAIDGHDRKKKPPQLGRVLTDDEIEELQ